MKWLSLLIILGLLVLLAFQIKDLVLVIKERKKNKNQNKNKEDTK